MKIKKVKAIVYFLILLPCLLFSSDEISIDSLFESQSGTRSITSISFMSSSSSRSYNIYPLINSYDDGFPISQTKRVILNHAFTYTYNNNVDILTSFTADYTKIDIILEKTFSKVDTSFLSSWFGLTYNFDAKIGDLKQSITTQVALYEKNNYRNMEETSNLKSFNIRYGLLAYLDPVVINMSLSTIQNSTKTIKNIKVDYPNVYTFGLDTNMILSPSLSISLSFSQSYQEPLKEDNNKVNPSTLLSEMGFGFNYNINTSNALIVSTSIGTSSEAPDSSLSLALWHKY